MFPQAQAARTAPVLFTEPQPAWRPGDILSSDQRLRYKYNEKELIVGGSLIGFGFTVQTLISSGIAFSGFGVLFAPIGTIPVIGGYPLAGFSALLGAGPGTVGALIGFSVLQSVGLGVLIHGLVSRQPLGPVPKCQSGSLFDHLVLSPMAAPNGGGLSLGGAL